MVEIKSNGSIGSFLWAATDDKLREPEKEERERRETPLGAPVSNAKILTDPT